MTKSNLTIGSEITVEKTVTEKDIEQFAQISLDRNPIHFSDDFASSTIFGKRIAHGMIGAAIISGALTKLIGDGNLWLSSNLEFNNPTFVNDKLSCRLKILQVERRCVYKLDVLVVNDRNETVIRGNVKTMKTR